MSSHGVDRPRTFGPFFTTMLDVVEKKTILKSLNLELQLRHSKGFP